MIGNPLDDVLGTLSDLHDIELPPADWQAVAGIVDALAAEISQGDLAEVDRLHDDLQDCFPSKVKPIGKKDGKSTPRPVPVADRLRDRIDTLVDEIKVNGRDGR